MKLYSRTEKYNHKKNYLIIIDNLDKIKSFDFLEEYQKKNIISKLKDKSIFYFYTKSNFIIFVYLLLGL